jgi:putative endonuclease
MTLKAQKDFANEKPLLYNISKRGFYFMSRWYVYILMCSDKSFYVGSTTNIKRRLSEHNNRKGGSYTRARLPVKLIYKETYPNRSTAQKREAQIKRLRRKKKLSLITENIDVPKELS